LAISSGLEERLTNSFGIPFKHIYKEKREPINRVELAKTYLKLLEDGKFETQAELSRHLGVSRAWVTIIMNTIKNKNPN